MASGNMDEQQEPPSDSALEREITADSTISNNKTHDDGGGSSNNNAIEGHDTSSTTTSDHTTTAATTTTTTTAAAGSSPPWAWMKAANDILNDEPWVPIGQGAANGNDNSGLPVQVLPWLYLSDFLHAENAKLMMELGVTHVLSTNAMSKDSTNRLSQRLKRVNIQHTYVKGYDQEGYDMISHHWDDCLSVLQNVRQQHYRQKQRHDKNDRESTTPPPPPIVCVHCVAGTNRSGLIVCAAMMVLERFPVLEVIRRVKHLRGTLLTNESFQRQLCHLASQEGLLGDKPKGYSDEPIPIESYKEFLEPLNALERVTF